MSVKASSRVWESDLETRRMIVLLAMADHADDEGRSIFPSVKRIAWKCKMSERQVQRHLAALRADGILKVISPATRYKPNEYAIVYAALPKKEPFESGVTDTTPLGSSGVTSTTVRGDTGDVSGVTPTSPESSIEPSANRQLGESSFVSEGLSEDQIQKLIADDPSCGLF